MNTLRSIFSFIRNNFFYDFRSSIITISILCVIIFMSKMLKDKGSSPITSLKYLAGTATSFSIFLLMYY